MLGIRDRILVVALATVLAGVTGAWAVVAVLPVNAPPRPALGTSALPTATAENAAAARLPIAPDRVPSTGPAATPSPAAGPEPGKEPPAQRPDDQPTAGREISLKLEGGTSASLDPKTGQLRLRTPFGDLDLKL